MEGWAEAAEAEAAEVLATPSGLPAAALATPFALPAAREMEGRAEEAALATPSGLAAPSSVLPRGGGLEWTRRRAGGGGGGSAGDVVVDGGIGHVAASIALARKSRELTAREQ